MKIHNFISPKIYQDDQIISIRLSLELDRLHNYPIVLMPIVTTADGEADCEFYRLSIEMPCV